MGIELSELSSLDVRAIVNEIRHALKGSILKNVLFTGEKDRHVFLLEFYSPGKGRAFVVFDRNRIFLTKSKLGKSRQNNLCSFMRKHLKGRRLLNVEQVEFERVVKFSFDGYNLFVELFHKGNVIVCDDKNKIIAVLKGRRWRNRTLLPGFDYKLPENEKRLNVVETNFEEFFDVLKSCEKNLFSFLASNIGLGRLHTEELCRLVNFDCKRMCKDFKKEEAMKILSSTRDFVGNFLNKKNLSREVEKLFREYWASVERKEEEAEVEKRKRIDEIRKSVLKKIEEEIEINKKVGEKIYENYNLISKAINEGKEEICINGVNIKLSTSLTPEKNAEIYFEKAKKLKKKRERILSVLAKEKKKTSKNKRAEKKIEWFERFRHFFTSDGFLVVAGKDAKTNERLVKRYAKRGDLIFHADVRGSPFVLIRSEGRRISERAKKEASQFAACLSSAWKVGIASVDVYCVRPEQVTKKAPPGMYLPRGSFMIYGEREWFRMVPLKLAIGVDERGKLISGPEEGVKSKTKHFVIVVPGERGAKEISSEIKNKLVSMVGKNMDINEVEIARRIPYGRGEIA